MRHDQRFVGLDLIRGLAAVAVCAEHARHVVLVDHAALAAPSPAQQLLYAATGLGHEAVVVFFVMSGFFVGGALLRQDGFDAGAYALARLTRLWGVLLPALLATAAVDTLTATLAPQALAGAYRATWHSGPGPDEPYAAGAATFLANLAFLQTIAAPVFGSNGPLWSLACEFWYYVLFPPCLLAAGGGGRHALVGRGAAGAAALALWLALPGTVQAGFAVWLLGVAVQRAVGRLGPARALSCVVLGGVLLGLALANAKSGGSGARAGASADLFTGAAFAVLMAGVVNLRARPRGAPARWAAHAADMSYSLYLVHFPVVVLIGAAVYGGQRRLPTAQGVAELAAWLAALLLLGHGFWWCFERHTPALRRRLQALRCRAT